MVVAGLRYSQQGIVLEKKFQLLSVGAPLVGFFYRLVGRLKIMKGKINALRPFVLALA
jgi:hypothetical protein